MPEEQNPYKYRKNKGGRIKKKESDKRKNRSVWLSDNELSVLQKKYTKLNNQSITFSKFLRDLLLKQKVNHFVVDKTKMELVYELAKIGTNINQIAKQLNQNGRSDSLNDSFLLLTKTLEQIYIKMYGAKD